MIRNEEPREIVISVEEGYSGKKLELRVPPDSDIWEWEENFRTILTFLTFTEGSLNAILHGEEE